MATLDAFTEHVRPSVRGCPDYFIDSRVLETARDFCARTDILREVVTATASQSTSAYPISPTAGNSPVRALLVSVDDEVIPPVTHRVSDFIATQDESAPSAYTFSNGILELVPVPDGEYSVRVLLSVAPSSDATAIPDELYNNWLHAIVAGAKANLLSTTGADWYDPQAALVFTREYERRVLDARRHSIQGGAVISNLRVAIPNF